MSREVIEFGRLQEGPGYALLYGFLFLALVGLLFWIYRRDAERLSPGVRRLLLFLRAVLCIVLFLVFLDPQTRTETSIERPSRVIVAVDASLSMTITDPADPSPADSETQSSKVLAALRDSTLLSDLARTQEVAVYAFGKSVRSAGLLPRGSDQQRAQDRPEEPAISWDELSPTDEETRIGDSLADIFRDNRTAPLAGVIVFTDGQTNAGADVDAAIRMAKEVNAPILPVGIGAEGLPVNLRVSDVQVPARAFKGDQFRGKAFVQGVGMPGQRVTVEVLLKPSGENVDPVLLEAQEVPLPDDESLVPIEFTYLPEVTGRWDILVRAAKTPAESFPDDNAASAAFEVIDQSTKVLVLSGGPTREYRFLRNLLYRDPSIDVSVHLQSSGSLTAQEADAVLPVLPESRDEMFAFDVVVAIDPDWSAVSRTTIELLGEWVSTQAGGLILVAGAVNTPKLTRLEDRSILDALYPVTLKEVFATDFDAGRFVQPWAVEFTPEGASAAYLRIEDDAELSALRWSQFEGIYWCFPVKSIKPSATVLANFGDPRARSGGVAPPLFAMQFYGAGRVFYLGTGEMWRLRQFSEDYYDRFWVRLIRELGQGRLLRGASRGVLLVESDRFPVGANVPLRAQVLGSDYQPLLTPTVPVSIVDPKGRAASVELTPQVGRPGMFSATIPLRAPGEYRLQLLVPGTAEIVERRITAEVPQRELADPRINRPLLERLASQTGGKLFSLESLAEIPSHIEDRTETSILSGSPQPLWDNVWVLLAATALAGAEWLIRKLVYLA